MDNVNDIDEVEARTILVRSRLESCQFIRCLSRKQLGEVMDYHFPIKLRWNVTENLKFTKMKESFGIRRSRF